MNKRGAGISFIGIAAFLYGIRYIAAAIFGSKTTVLSDKFFNAALEYIGPSLFYLSVVSFIIGLIYLYFAEIVDSSEGNKDKYGD
ncbi:hypothetical protein [Paenibacillus cookii]|uniref:DUF1206 domain-containing protein n=1 Tax=Paenibacillus cookii TaxID=157839 RepID=A0ABQ4M4S8_9BACL|nr:hypothetical protein [Paenibacillus cookii]GIO70453.1 hypothetical protein J21TS3_52740 [Paenibacillus cookii]